MSSNMPNTITDEQKSKVERFISAAQVNGAIVERVVPELYFLINELVELDGKAIPKDLKVQARRALPPWCSCSFQK